MIKTGFFNVKELPADTLKIFREISAVNRCDLDLAIRNILKLSTGMQTFLSECGEIEFAVVKSRVLLALMVRDVLTGVVASLERDIGSVGKRETEIH